ncbi:MAG: hypothetical protein KAQ93_03320, partial [Spirochaetales bacterium]|nr:hypothetical protein [Spirochaetales bacterium]
YSFLFSFAMILSLILVFLSFLLVDKGSLSARETAAILFSFEGMRAYMDIGKLNATEDPVKKKTVLLAISRNEATVATEELHSILASPLSSGKGEVLKSLFSNPRPILLPDILNEASDQGSYHQLKAIFALGAYPGKETEQLLLELLESNEISVLSNTAKSLSRIGHTSSLSQIRRQAEGAENAWDKINYLIALRNMDKTGMIFLNTFKDANSINSGMFKQTYFSLVSDLLDFKPNLADIYSSKNMKSGDGVKNFLEQTRDLDFFYKSHKDLKGWFKTGNWLEIWAFCFNSLNGKKDLSIFSDPVKNLRAAVLAESNTISFVQMEDKDSVFDYDSALAAVFFTYQILNWS